MKLFFYIITNYFICKSPVVSDIYDLISALMGRSLFNEKETLDEVDRVLTLAALIPGNPLPGYVLRYGKKAMKFLAGDLIEKYFGKI